MRRFSRDLNGHLAEQLARNPQTGTLPAQAVRPVSQISNRTGGFALEHNCVYSHLLQPLFPQTFPVPEFPINRDGLRARHSANGKAFSLPGGSDGNS